MIEKVTQMQRAEALFDGWQETMIRSCLQQIMGEIYAPRGRQEYSAMAILGDFCIFAGKPERELTLFKPENKREQDFIIMVPQNEGWAEMIETCYGEKARKVSRYALKKEPDVFDRDRLERIRDGLPGDCRLVEMDEKLFGICRKTDWCRDWVSQYADYETYRKWGLGVVALKGDEPVSGASSYTRYLEGIEIEIDTKEPFRRKGLAASCGAALILACLERGLYPSWDAQNPWSLALAEKLGYHYSHTYTAYEIWGY